VPRFSLSPHVASGDAQKKEKRVFAGTPRTPAEGSALCTPDSGIFVSKIRDDSCGQRNILYTRFRVRRGFTKTPKRMYEKLIHTPLSDNKVAF